MEKEDVPRAAPLHAARAAVEEVRLLGAEIGRLTDGQLYALGTSMRLRLENTLERERLFSGFAAARQRRLEGAFEEAAALERELRSRELVLLDEVLPVAFVLASEAAARALRARVEDRHVLSAALLHRGTIVELEAGEDRFPPSFLAAFLGSLPGHGVHVVLRDGEAARRERARIRPALEMLGATTGLVEARQGRAARRSAYDADVTFAGSEELVLDFLRDNLIQPGDGELDTGRLRGIAEERPTVRHVLRPLHVALVDDVDATIVDRSERPLVLRKRGNGAPRAAMSVASFFRLYGRFGGTTATASWAADARRRIHGLDVVPIAGPRRKTGRRDHGDALHSTDSALVRAVVDEIAHVRAVGRPVVVAVPSGLPALAISGELLARRIDHANAAAARPSRVAEWLGQAGELGRVTIASYAQLQGAEIRVGPLTPWEFSVHRKACRAVPAQLPFVDSRGDHASLSSVSDLGGLHVVGIDRHRVSRLDAVRVRDLAGSRGEPGSIRFHASLADERLARLARPLASEEPVDIASAAQVWREVKLDGEHARTAVGETLLGPARSWLHAMRELRLAWWGEAARRRLLAVVDEVWSETLAELERLGAIVLDGPVPPVADRARALAVLEELPALLRARLQGRPLVRLTDKALRRRCVGECRRAARLAREGERDPPDWRFWCCLECHQNRS